MVQYKGKGRGGGGGKGLDLEAELPPLNLCWEKSLLASPRAKYIDTHYEPLTNRLPHSSKVFFPVGIKPTWCRLCICFDLSRLSTNIRYHPVLSDLQKHEYSSKA